MSPNADGHVPRHPVEDTMAVEIRVPRSLARAADRLGMDLGAVAATAITKRLRNERLEAEHRDALKGASSDAERDALEGIHSVALMGR